MDPLTRFAKAVFDFIAHLLGTYGLLQWVFVVVATIFTVGVFLVNFPRRKAKESLDFPVKPKPKNPHDWN